MKRGERIKEESFDLLLDYLSRPPENGEEDADYLKRKALMEEYESSISATTLGTPKDDTYWSFAWLLGAYGVTLPEAYRIMGVEDIGDSNRKYEKLAKNLEGFSVEKRKKIYDYVRSLIDTEIWDNPEEFKPYYPTPRVRAYYARKIKQVTWKKYNWPQRFNDVIIHRFGSFRAKELVWLSDKLELSLHWVMGLDHADVGYSLAQYVDGILDYYGLLSSFDKLTIELLAEDGKGGRD